MAVNGQSALKLRVSGDHLNGDPELQVFVDGLQIGGTYKVSAVYSRGEWQEIRVPGSFDPTKVQNVEVRFVNDLCRDGGTGEGFDRNLFVDWVEIGGKRLEGESAKNNASLGYDGMIPTAGVMLANGELSFAMGTSVPPSSTPPAPKPPAPVPPKQPPSDKTGKDAEPANALKLRVSGDHLNGDPELQVFVDGLQIGGTYKVSAVYSRGQWQEILVPGSFDPTKVQNVEVRFVNDLSRGGGTGEGFDRNLFVDWVEIGGKRLEGESAKNNASLGYDGMIPTAGVMLANGELSFAMGTSEPPSSTPPAPKPPAPAKPPAPVEPPPAVEPTPVPQPPSNVPKTSAQFFAANSLWNTAIASDAKLAANSGAIAKMLDDSPFGIQLNQSAWAVNVSFAPPGTPRHTVSGPDHRGGHWEIDNVPIAPDSFGTKDSDGHLVIVDRELGKIWNFMGAGNLPSSHQAHAFGVFDIDGHGWWDPSAGTGGPWTGRSSNASYLSGLIMPSELKAGHIPHALAVGVDISLMSTKPALPALTTDANGVPGGIPNGSRLQLDPNLDLSKLGLGKEAMVVAKALQEYGAFVVERTSGFALYFQGDQNLNYKPYAGMDFAGLDASLHEHWRVIAPTAPAAYDSVKTQPYVHWDWN